MHKGEEYQKLKQKSIEEKFVYDLTSKRHDVEKLYHLVQDAFWQADLNETSFCLNTAQKRGEIDDWFYANDEAFKWITKAYYSLQNDIRRLTK